MFLTFARFAAKHFVHTLSSAFIDHYVHPTVKPMRGSLVFCDLAAFIVEHSGIYIGQRQIVHLNGDGCIEVVSPEQFLARLEGYNFARSIYVSCQDNQATGNESVARRAENSVGMRRNYNLLADNCHQFSAGCLSGHFENNDNYMWRLKLAAQQHLQANQFLAWNKAHMLAS